MFSRRLPLTDLIDLCRVLRHQLGAGIAIQRIFEQQSQRGRRSFRAIAGRLSEAIRSGSGLADAFEKDAEAFPPLFLAMVKVGEATGHLSEVFGELERYFQLELQLRRQFRSQTILPIVQFVAAVFIIAGVIFVLGVIADMKNDAPLLTIFGLKGGAGALAFLGVVGGSLAFLYTLYLIATRLGRQQAWADRLLLRIPALGPCLNALAMSRLTLALQMTLDSGLTITRAIRLAFQSTGNAYFLSRSEIVEDTLKKGKSLYDALGRSRLFDEQFMEMIFSSEAAGSVPEMMRHLAQQYQEETARRMTALTRISGAAVACCVAGFIIWAIFRLAMVYLNALEGKF